jgi:hypothetical protein
MTIPPAEPVESPACIPRTVLSAAHGTISKITVRLVGFNHLPDDVDVLLVGPTGAMAMFCRMQAALTPRT